MSVTNYWSPIFVEVITMSWLTSIAAAAPSMPLIEITCFINDKESDPAPLRQEIKLGCNKSLVTLRTDIKRCTALFALLNIDAISLSLEEKTAYAYPELTRFRSLARLIPVDVSVLTLTYLHPSSSNTCNTSACSILDPASLAKTDLKQ